MRVAVGGYLTCTNSFATQPLGLEQFERSTLTGDKLLRTGRGWSAIAGFLDIAKKNNWDVAPLQLGGFFCSDIPETGISVTVT